MRPSLTGFRRLLSKGPARKHCSITSGAFHECEGEGPQEMSGPDRRLRHPHGPETPRPL